MIGDSQRVQDGDDDEGSSRHGPGHRTRQTHQTADQVHQAVDQIRSIQNPVSTKAKDAEAIRGKIVNE